MNRLLGLGVFEKETARMADEMARTGLTFDNKSIVVRLVMELILRGATRLCLVRIVRDAVKRNGLSGRVADQLVTWIEGLDCDRIKEEL